MKKVILVAIAATFSFMSKAGDEKVVPSEIKSVTVYSQGAQIYRKSNYSVASGVTEVIIEGISPNIDPNSLQVLATGNVVILDSKYSVYYPKPEEIKLEGLPLKIRKQIFALEDSIVDMNYAIQELKDEIDVYQATKNILASNGAIRGQGKVNDSIQLLKEAVDYYTFKMMEINKKMQTLNRSYNKKTIERNGMNTRLAELRNFQSNNNLNPQQKGPIHRIVITLSSKESAKGRIDLSYLVSSAGWTPLYDLRSDVNSGKVNLNYKAQVYQNTGVDWEDIQLSISTNNPYQNKTKPTLNPWYVDYYAYRTKNANKKSDAYGSPLQQKSEELYYSSDRPTSTVANGSVAEEVYADYSYDFVEVVNHVISAEFKIDLPYTIKSNNEQHMVLVKNEDLNADFKYYTVPKYDASAYLVAEISKLDELQLVPAKANIFFDGSYIGETYLDPTSMDDTLQLSLGKDPNIIVKRTLLEHECKDKVVGSNKERSFAYAIEVKNLKSSSIELVIQDQIPVTSNSDITIEAEELSKGELDKRTGIIEWNLTIKSKVKKEVQFKYNVKHPKDQNVVLN